MERIISLIYFIGLFIFGISIGSYCHVPQYAFMIIGGGIVIYTAIAGIVIYLNKHN